MITCTACGYDQNPDNTEFCSICGSELPIAVTTASTTSPTIAPTIIKPPIQPAPPPISDHSYSPTIPLTRTSATARLVCKQINAPIPEFILENNAIVGIFDQDTGPVDIDLETFLGGDTVSRNHAEIYQEAGIWKVKDLGSTNGVFIKGQGQTRFSARITVPTALKPDDEIAFGKVKFVFKNS
ncbi:FHA domain-containing protein [Cylindrospermopsis raciborskii]|uniref:FHA domain-containing protein n=1 Tax=Cylindrospermopsis raciborskii TaxID=77022 RepID=UPI001143777E|nr:FHA domain-containing protein [Cylindrospermopsis raciborskii]TPX28019.1 FHA domain-containing protein [Cylindrospermopsis raciborskii GIHE 2018]